MFFIVCLFSNVYTISSDLFESILNDKISRRDYIKIHGSDVYDIVHIEFNNDFFEVVNYTNKKNKRKVIFSSEIDSDRTINLFEQVISSVFNFFNESMQKKVLVFKKRDCLLYEYVNDFIDEFKRLNDTRKKFKRSFQYYFIIEEDSLIFKTIELAPFKKEHKLTQIYSMFINFVIFSKENLYVFEVDLHDLKSNEYFKKIQKTQFTDVISHILDLYGISELINPIELNLKKINMSNIKKIETKSSFFSKENLLILYKSDNLIFYNCEYKIVFSHVNFTKSSKRTQKLNFSKRKYTKKFLKIKKDDFDNILTVVKYIYKLKSKHFKEEDYFYRLLLSNNLVETIICQILKSANSGLKIFFCQLCFNTKIISFDEFLVLTKLNDKVDLSTNKIQDNVLAKKLQEIISYFDNGVTYLMKICLFIKVEDLIRQTDFLEHPVFKKLKLISQICRKNFHKNQYKYRKEDFDLLEVFQEIFKNKHILTNAVKVTELKIREVIDNYEIRE